MHLPGHTWLWVRTCLAEHSVTLACPDTLLLGDLQSWYLENTSLPHLK